MEPRKGHCGRLQQAASHHLARARCQRGSGIPADIPSPVTPPTERSSVFRWIPRERSQGSARSLVLLTRSGRKLTEREPSATPAQRCHRAVCDPQSRFCFHCLWKSKISRVKMTLVVSHSLNSVQGLCSRCFNVTKA